jgi:putative FmdB family regulatory protein
MPIYEYRCHDCSQCLTLLSRTYASPEPPHCPHCGGDNLSRLISKVAVKQSERERLRDLSWLDRDIKRRFTDKLKGD